MMKNKGGVVFTLIKRFIEIMILKILFETIQNFLGAAALRTDQKGKTSFCHSVRVALALNDPITTVCKAFAYIP